MRMRSVAFVVTVALLRCGLCQGAKRTSTRGSETNDQRLKTVWEVPECDDKLISDDGSADGDAFDDEIEEGAVGHFPPECKNLEALWYQIDRVMPINFSSSLSSDSVPPFISNRARWLWALKPPIEGDDTNKEKGKGISKNAGDYHDWNANPLNRIEPNRKSKPDKNTGPQRHQHSVYLAAEYAELATPHGRCDFPKVVVGSNSHRGRSSEDTDDGNIHYIATAEEFIRTYMHRPPAEQVPVVVLNGTSIHPFTRLSSRPLLLYCFGDFPVKLSSANKHSYEKKTVLLKEYLLGINDDSEDHTNSARVGAVDHVTHYMSKQSITSTGKGTWYFFGDNNALEWAPLFSEYVTPSAFIDTALNPYMSFSFGIGASGTGVPFHTHGPVWAEVFYGYKRWWLRSPTTEADRKRIAKQRSSVLGYEIAPDEGVDNAMFRQDPDGTSLKWMRDVLPKLLSEQMAAEKQPEERMGDKAKSPNEQNKSYRHDISDLQGRLLDCTLGPGELLYIPLNWHHSTLNIGDSVFMSSFI